MDLEVVHALQGEKAAIWREFLSRAGLEADESVEQTALVWDGEELIAVGSRRGNLLKCIAVAEQRQGEGLLAKVLTPLRQEAMLAGHRRLFLYTKPANETLFSGQLFYAVAKTESVLVMEDQKHGLRKFLESMPAESGEGLMGAAVMNCDPFTLGHRYLIEQAAAECERLYVFVLSEDGGHFSPHQRMEMVRRGTADLENVRVLPTGPYLISRATFPTYFLKERDKAEEIHCLLDIEIFAGRFAPHFGITRRYVGTEPLSAMTQQYNQVLLRELPRRGIEVREIRRLEQDGVPVSASAVRAALQQGNWAQLRTLVPESTYVYLKEQ